MKLPEEYVKRMALQLNDGYPAYLKAMEEPPKRALRCNALKCTPEKLKALLPALIPLPQENPAESFLLPEGFAPGRDVFHRAGLYYVQELSAQYPVSLLDVQPGMAVLDLCAAPGGKSAQIAAALRGEGVLFANEIVPGRAKILLGNLERMGVSNAVVTSMEPDRLVARTGPVFDRVLIDAPCAGEGMFRKDYEAIQQWSPAHVTACAQRQRLILEAAQGALKPGGKLVYSTCSFSPEENEQTAALLLKNHKEFTLLKQSRLYPHTSLGEGQYAALFLKDGELTPPAFIPQKESGLPLAKAFLEENLYPLPGTLLGLPDGRALLVPPLPVSLQGLRVLRAGLLLGAAEKGRFTPAHALAMAGRESPFIQRAALSIEEAQRYLKGETLSTALNGWCAVTAESFSLGLGKGADGILKNHLPKGLRLN